MSDPASGKDAQALVAMVVDIGLFGSAPRDYGKHVNVAKRMLKKAPLEHWKEVAEAMRESMYPFSNGSPFDVFDLERNEHKVSAHIGKSEGQPDWFRGYGNDAKPQEPVLGEEWE